PPEAWQVPAGAATPRRRGWLVVLSAVLGVTLAAAVAGTALFVDRSLPPFDAANDFVNDILDGHEHSAARRLCSIDRADAQRAIDDVKQTFGPRRAKISVNPFGVDRSGDRATVEYTVDASGSRFDHTYKLAVRVERGDWKVCP